MSEQLKSLYISRKYFEDYPEKAKLAMMSDGEIYFFQIEGDIEILIRQYPDIQEVVKMDTRLLILCREAGDVDKWGFEQMISKYENGMISHIHDF